MPSKPRGTGVRGHRLNPQQSDRCRNAIATSQIVNRLNAFVKGDEDPQTGKPVEMSPHQVTAALGLLRKVIPDLQSVEGNLSVTVSHEDVLRELETAVETVETNDAAYH